METIEILSLETQILKYGIYFKNSNLEFLHLNFTHNLTIQIHNLERCFMNLFTRYLCSHNNWFFLTWKIPWWKKWDTKDTLVCQRSQPVMLAKIRYFRTNQYFFWCLFSCYESLLQNNSDKALPLMYSLFVYISIYR